MLSKNIRIIDGESAKEFLKETMAQKERVSYSPNGLFYGYFENGTLIGVISTLENAKTIRVKSFFVLKENRGNGVGSDLLHYILTRNKRYTAFATESSYPLFKKESFITVSERNGIRFMTRRKERNDV
jgi:GNAT superfamily N-acetyltransferase